MPAKIEYSDEQREAALTLIRKRVTFREVSAGSGVSIPTLMRWAREERDIATRRNMEDKVKLAGGSTDAQVVTDRMLGVVVMREVERIINERRPEIEEMVRARVGHTIETVSQSLLKLAGDTVIQMLDVVEAGPGVKESNAEWLKALTVVIDKTVEKHQLLTGRPTGINTVFGDAEIRVRLEKYENVYSRLAERPIIEGEARALPSGDEGDHPRKPLHPHRPRTKAG